MGARAYYDDRPPIVLHSSVPVASVVQQGGVLQYVSTYSKRAECYRPQGTGEVSYTLARLNDDQTEHRDVVFHFDFKREAKWPAGENLTHKSAVPIPADIPPGHYMYEATAKYICAGASKPLIHVGPTLPIVVVAKS